MLTDQNDMALINALRLLAREKQEAAGLAGPDATQDRAAHALHMTRYASLVRAGAERLRAPTVLAADDVLMTSPRTRLIANSLASRPATSRLQKPIAISRPLSALTARPSLCESSIGVIYRNLAGSTASSALPTPAKLRRGQRDPTDAKELTDTLTMSLCSTSDLTSSATLQYSRAEAEGGARGAGATTVNGTPFGAPSSASASAMRQPLSLAAPKPYSVVMASWREANQTGDEQVRAALDELAATEEKKLLATKRRLDALRELADERQAEKRLLERELEALKERLFGMGEIVMRSRL